jgi:hypothetical protein
MQIRPERRGIEKEIAPTKKCLKIGKMEEQS